jgi:two-component system C4-dicarboxylate transport sensor histidine kinase DctB
LLFHYKATKEHIFLQFEAKERIQLFGNPVKFHQVIANLVSNAIDSYDDITMKDSMEKSVTVFLTTDNENIEIKVEDHGHGIKKEAADHIFDPFFTTKSSDKGIGLGLSTTKEIIQKEFDGTITFSSTGTDDTTFIITLPCTSYEKNTGP